MNYVYKLMGVYCRQYTINSGQVLSDGLLDLITGQVLEIRSEVSFCVF